MRFTLSEKAQIQADLQVIRDGLDEPKLDIQGLKDKTDALAARIERLDASLDNEVEPGTPEPDPAVQAKPE